LRIGVVGVNLGLTAMDIAVLTAWKVVIARMNWNYIRMMSGKPLKDQVMRADKELSASRM
jgi:hypothetical protein